MRESGLSLLELLVSIVLMAIVAAFLSNALSLSGRVDEASRTASIQMEREATAIAALRKVLELAEPPTRNRPETAFDGNSDRIAFATTLPPRLSGGGLLELEIDCGGKDGIAASWRRPPRQNKRGRDRDWTETLTVWPNTSCRNIAYFGLPDPASSGSAQWHKRWPEGALSLPHLVRLEVVEADDTVRLLHIAPRNTTLLAAAGTGDR